MFGDGFDDPKSAALMALSAGLMKRDFAGGLLGANAAYADAQKSKLQQGLLGAQMDNYKSEIAQRAAAIEKQKQIQAMTQGLLNGGGGAAPAAPGQMGSGSFGVVPPAQGQSDMPAAAPRGLAGASLEQIAGLHAVGGPDLLNAYKFAKEGIERKPGSFYDDLQGRRQYIPNPKDNIDFNPATKEVSLLPGAEQTQSALTYASEEAKARAGAQYAVEKVYNPATGRDELVSRATVLGNPQPPRQQAMPQPMTRPGQQQGPAPMQPQGAPVGAFTSENTPAEIMAAIIAIPDPKERARAMTAYQEQAKRSQGFTQPQGMGFAAGPSADEAAAAAASKARAVGTAEADVKRNTTNQEESKKYRQMIANTDRAIELLQAGPTESGFGKAVDATMGFFGQSTTGADLASKLKVIGGAMTSNVPRMEGPQSDRDVISYREQAGQVADDTLPVSRRIAAAQEVKNLQLKYAHLNGWAPGNGNGNATAPAAEAPKASKVLDTLPKLAPKGQRVRDTVTGDVMVFDGLSWKKEK